MVQSIVFRLAEDLDIGIGEYTQWIQSAERDVSNLCSWRHSYPQEELIYLQAELKACASVVGLWSYKDISVYREECLAESSANAGLVRLCDVNPDTRRRLMTRDRVGK